MSFKSLLTAVLALFLIGVNAASAHELIVKPQTARAKVGQTVPFSVVSAHVFMISEELENAKDVRVKLVDTAGLSDLAVKPDQTKLAFAGQAVFTKPGYALLVADRLPQTWTLTPEGMKPGTKADFPGATVSNIYEKYAKTLILVDKPDDGWKRSAGQRLEIMPLSDPSAWKPGNEVRFQILFEGKPLSTEVLATYDGFTKTPNSYAYFTETDDKGVATVKLTSQGLWMVRVQHKVPGKDGIKENVMRSVLVFGVQ